MGDQSVKTGYPALLALMFPWLYPNCVGHYPMINTARIRDKLRNEQGQVIQEQHGGYADASFQFTQNEYTKSLLLSKDRRFARDPSFLFFMFDSIERGRIQSSARFTTLFQPGMTKRDIMHQGSFRKKKGYSGSQDR